MKRLGVNTDVGMNLNNPNNNILKKHIEVSKNIRRLSFLNKNNEDNNNVSSENKGNKVKIKEINDVFKNCMTALSHNKVCTRNAFDIRIIEHLEDLVNLNDEEINEELNKELVESGEVNLSFTRASKAIEGATKVYGYRVEAIYDQTYNFISNMNIVKQSEIQEEVIDDDKINGTSELTTKRMKKRKLEIFQESSTLAKPSDITMDNLVVSNISVDTFFLKLNATYDHSMCQNYLLSNLVLNNDLSIQFDGDIDVCEYIMKKKNEEKIKDGNVNTCVEGDTTVNVDLGSKKRKSRRASVLNNHINKVQYDNEDNDDMILTERYKEQIYLNTDVLKDILKIDSENSNESLNNLNICPELNYFKEEVDKYRLKKSDSKSYDEIDDSNYDFNLNGDEGQQSHRSIKKMNNSSEYENKKDLNLGDSGMLSIDMMNELEDNNSTIKWSDKKTLNSSMGHSMGHGDNYAGNSGNTSFGNNLGIDYNRIEDLNIENVMQESMAFDMMNLNDSFGNNINMSQNTFALNEQHNNSSSKYHLPELIKSQENNFSLLNHSLSGNFHLGNHPMVSPKSQSSQLQGLNSQLSGITKNSMISIIPDDDVLWDRNILTFENRINALDAPNNNIKFNYHYYNPSKLMAHSNLRSLFMDLGKPNIEKNKQSLVNNILLQKKLKTSFQVTDIDFENLYVEINDVELSSYDLWKKEKKKYISNALFSIDHTSYIFETKDNCIRCINTVVDKIMKFTKTVVTDSQRNRFHENSTNAMTNQYDNTDVHLNVVLNDINNDFIGNDLDMTQLGENKNGTSMYAENMDDMQDIELQGDFNDAIDKYYNMDFEDVWENDNKKDLSKEESNKIEHSAMLQLQKSGSRSNSMAHANFESLSKFVDVSKVKKILCDVVKPDENDSQNSSDQKDECMRNGQVGVFIVPYEGEKTTTFVDILEKTKQKLSAPEVKGLSVHMLFVCLLYTCNDQELLLEKIPNDENFYIRYGLPLECHIKNDDTLMLTN
ncbi:chromosome condensation protein, putative [Hepatocystis sp. ex Piliocolobus tephrosceles]|nr:chromosome condensation protein, putative [Hepatocystis sp. ex Piliocolobus tephrosceles]